MEPWQLAFRDRADSRRDPGRAHDSPEAAGCGADRRKDARRRNTGIPERVPFCEERDGLGLFPDR